MLALALTLEHCPSLQELKQFDGEKSTVQYLVSAKEGPGQERDNRVVVFTIPALPHRKLDDHVFVHSSKLDHRRRILHVLTDDPASVDDLVKQAFMLAHSDEYARVYSVEPGPPASRRSGGFHVVFQLGSHTRSYQVRHELVRAGEDQVFTLVADIRRRVHAVGNPGRDQQRAGERLCESRGSGDGCERVEEVRRELECKVPAC